jgi:hypothetical protein
MEQEPGYAGGLVAVHRLQMVAGSMKVFVKPAEKEDPRNPLLDEGEMVRHPEERELGPLVLLY